MRGTDIAGEVLLLAQDSVVYIELARERCDCCIEYCIVGNPSMHPITNHDVFRSRTTSDNAMANSRLEHFLDDGLFSEGVEVESFDRHGLFEEGVRLGVGRNECGSLFRVFRSDVASDRSALVQNETIVVLVMNKFGVGIM